MNSSTRKFNDLMYIFGQTSDEEEQEIESRDKVDDLHLKNQAVSLLESKTKYFTPTKSWETRITFNPPQLFDSRSIDQLKSITFQPHLIELTIQSKQKDSIDQMLHDTCEQVKSLGLIDRISINTIHEKISSLKKIINQLVENYFQLLNNQLESIINNPSLLIFKDKTLQELNKLRKNTEQHDQTTLRSRLWAIKNLIKQKDIDVPKTIFANVNVNCLTQLQEIFAKLISIQVKDQINFLPPNMSNKKLLLKSNSDIRISEDIFVYSLKNNCFFHLNVKKFEHLNKIEWVRNDDIVLPSTCQLVHLVEAKQLILICIQLNQYEPTNTVLRFDLVTQHFTQMCCMPCQINQSCIALKSNYLYVWGGVVKINEDRLFAKRGYKFFVLQYSKQRYDTLSDIWSQIPSMQNPRALGQTCSVGQKIYIIGGMQNKFIPNRLIEIYNVGIGAFEPTLQILNYLSYVPPISGFAQQISQKEILLFGGMSFNNQNHTLTSQVIDISQGTFQQGKLLCPLRFDGFFTQPIVFDSRIYALSGSGEDHSLWEINQSGCNTKCVYNLC